MNSIKKTARITGLLYLMMTPLAIFGILYVPSVLILPGDAITTVKNIMANELLFRLSIVSALLVQIFQIFVVLYLYKILKPVNRNYAVLMAVFILAAVPIAMFNELNNYAVLLLSRGAGNLPVFTAEQVQSLVPFFLEFHKCGINIASIFWGLWLFPMGYLVFKSGFLPRVLGVLLMFGCFGYLIDVFTFFLFPNFTIKISQFTFFGELLLPLWLLIKGVNVEKWEKCAQKTA